MKKMRILLPDREVNFFQPLSKKEVFKLLGSYSMQKKAWKFRTKW